MNELDELFEAFLVTNGEVRTELVNGRECLITDATILKQGVLSGSDGPLFYSKTEIGRQIGIWNGTPIVAPHPYIWQDGEMKHVSAREPEIDGKFEVGRVYNDRMEGDERKVTLYVDVENANRLDGRIVPAIRAGEPINVSTGIFTEKRKAVENSRFNDKPYSHTVHYIQPDHLAILMDERGACSVTDGCGININAETLKKWSREEVEAVTLYNRDWPKSKRESLQKSAPGDFAGPHQSFPIKTQEDVNSAAKLTGHADDPAAVRAKIKAIAKRKGLKVPTSWEKKGTKNADDMGDDTITDNAWTSAARSASLSARRKTEHAIKTDKQMKGANGLRGHADAAVSHHTAGEFSKAHGSHQQAMQSHNLAGRAATKRGDHSAASAHRDAASAHKTAGGMYKKQTRNAGGGVYPDSCPECGKSINQDDGICEGCGYRVKKRVSNSKGDTMEEKGELVSWLTTNCGCWKGDPDASETVLNTLSEDQLKTLKTNAQKAAFTEVATGIVKKVANQVGFNAKDNFNNLPSFVANAMKKNPKDDDEDDTVDNATPDKIPPGIFDSANEVSGTTGLEDFKPIGSEGTRKNGGTRSTDGKLTKGGGADLPSSGQLGVMNAVKKIFADMTAEQYKNMAPPSVKALLNTAEKINFNHKVQIINSLTCNMTDVKSKKIMVAKLAKRSIPELEDMMELAGITNATPTNNAKTEEDLIMAQFFQTGSKQVQNTGEGNTNTNGLTSSLSTNAKGDPLLPYMSVEDLD